MPHDALDPGVVHRFVLRNQHLAGGPPAGIVEVARHVGGLHNTGPSTPYLSLFARVPGFTRTMLYEEMYARKGLVRIRCMRNTMHILPRNLLPSAFMATRKCVGVNAERFLVYRGMNGEEYTVAAEKITELLSDGGLTIAQLKKAVGPVTSLPAVLTLMCDRGVLVRGETPNWRSNAYTYHLISEYLPDVTLDSIDEREAVLQLARLYFSAFGPATVEDFAWWSGIGKTMIRDILEDLPVAHVEISGLKGDFMLLQDDLRALGSIKKSAGAVVNLLPGLDPYVMGYKLRERYLSPESYSFVFDRSGNSANTVAVNGRLCGVWDTEKDETPVVKYFLFEQVDQAIKRQIEKEAARLGQFIFDRPVSVRECRSMVPLTQRNAGAVLAPLKDL